MPDAEARARKDADPDAGAAGFTLIEVLVAFLVLALATLVVQRAVMTSVSLAGRADVRLRAEMVARTLISAPLKPGTVALSPASGVMDGLSWTLRLEPLDLPFPTGLDAAGERPAFTPVRLVATVALAPRPGFAAGVGTVRVETVRLVAGARP